MSRVNFLIFCSFDFNINRTISSQHKIVAGNDIMLTDKADFPYIFFCRRKWDVLSRCFCFLWLQEWVMKDGKVLLRSHVVKCDPSPVNLEHLHSSTLFVNVSERFRSEIESLLNNKFYAKNSKWTNSSYRINRTVSCRSLFAPINLCQSKRVFSAFGDSFKPLSRSVKCK